MSFIKSCSINSSAPSGGGTHGAAELWLKLLVEVDLVDFQNFGERIICNGCLACVVVSVSLRHDKV